MENKFYTYIYWRTDKELPEPFYVGKGTGNRYLARHNNRYFNNIIRFHHKRKIKPEVTFIYSGDSEEMAFYYEKLWIKFLGRKDLNLGTLVNLTDGGDGVSGFRPSQITLKKLSESHKGHKHTEEQKRKISESCRGKKHYRFGKHCSLETKEKISLTKKERPYCFSKEQKRKISQKVTESKSQKWFVTCPNGNQEEVTNLKKFCDENGLNQGKMSLVANSYRKQHKGFTVNHVY